jgi:putative ABC transport system ATP-binding protein/lipoprotein-releasing system ATP-binding protein
MTEIVVEAVGVARSFERGNRTIEALAPATCRVRAGDRIALMGPSGSGKSTLLHLMAGLDQPSAGEIRWPMLRGPDTLRPGKVAVVFQSPSLMPALSVVENVELPLILGDTPGNTRGAAMDTLTRVGLAELAKKLPEELSGGQAQRVAMARAMAVRPQLFLADEPTGQLDQSTGKALIDCLLEWLAGSRTALVIATHDPAVAERMTDVWRMDHGRLLPPIVGGER